MSVASVSPLHYESAVTLNAPPETAFAFLDDFKKLSAHMQKSSAMMMGSKMTITTDALDGRAVGSRVRMDGRMLGMTLSLAIARVHRLRVATGGARPVAR